MAALAIAAMLLPVRAQATPLTNAQLRAPGEIAGSSVAPTATTAVAGRKEVRTTEGDTDADGTADNRSVVTTEYDKKGRVVRQTELSNANDLGGGGDGTVFSRGTTTTEYDKRGDQLTYLGEDDTDGNGKVASRVTGTWSYNARGKLLGAIFEIDEANTPGGEVDGIIDVRQAVTMEYDKRGKLVRQVNTDTVVAFETTIVTALYAYDKRGNVTRTQVDVDASGDGTPDLGSVVVATYDSRKQLLMVVSDEDLDADGTVDARTILTVVYERL